VAVYADGAWEAHRDAMVAHALGRSSSVRRRRAFVAHLVAESAGFSGDTATCLAMIAHAIEEGPFDLHGLDRCPLLDIARATPELAARARLKQRADAILDALYGDQDVSGLTNTVAASLA
jgi:hypothetical protein